MGFLAGKRALIVGLATERSIAYGIAAAMRREGADLACTYQNDRLKERVAEMAQGFGAELVLPMDVAHDAEIHSAFERIGSAWGFLDIIVHSVAFAPREQLVVAGARARDGRGPGLDALRPGLPFGVRAGEVVGPAMRRPGPAGSRCRCVPHWRG